WGAFSAFNVAAPTLVWIHAVEHFRREQALRLFALVSVGGTLGALVGNASSSLQAWAGLAPSWSAVGSLLLLEAAFFCYLGSQRACRAMAAGSVGSTARPPAAGGNVFAAIPLLLRSPRLLGIAFYMVLYGVVQTAFAFRQTQVMKDHGSGAEQHWFL